MNTWEKYWTQWHAKAEAKAMRESARYREIRETLRTPSGMIRYDHDLMEERFKIFWEVNRRPVFWHVHNGWEQYGVPTQWAHIKVMWQRARRGWADSDVWSLDSYLTDVITGMISDLRDNAHGYPGNLGGMPEWVDILNEIVDGFEAKRELNESALSWSDPAAAQRLEAKFERGMELLTEYWSSLWD